jgi:hypothetical protein
VSIEDVLWDGLTPEQRSGLLTDFVSASAWHGADILMVPVLGYADLAAFRAAGFRKSRRLVHAYITQWSPQQQAEPFGSLYLDVI